jgi:hypothetical protein
VLIGAPPYGITGARESELGQYVGRRIEVTGTIEQARVAAPPTSGSGSDPVGNAGRVRGGLPPAGSTGVTPGGSPAHEQGDAIPGTAATTGASPVARPGGTAPADLARINVTAFRVVEGACENLTPPATAPAPRGANVPPSEERPAPPAPREAATTPPPEPITVVGCLVRQTTAEAGRTGDELVLTQAVPRAAGTTPPASAVPGSAPSGSGSGTVPPAPAAQDAGTGTNERSFAIAANGDDRAALAKRVGQRVEILGILDESTAAGSRTDEDTRRRVAEDAGGQGRVEKPAQTAHPSAPVRRITVTSFRAVGGTCN